jgi:hypothetical protein
LEIFIISFFSYHGNFQQQLRMSCNYKDPAFARPLTTRYFLIPIFLIFPTQTFLHDDLGAR